MRCGIDVSFHKGFPDWSQCKGRVTFAILGVTERYGDDKSFEHNYSGAKSIGIPIGAYKYSYARTWEESKAEAQRIIDILAGRPLEMGIWLDLEWDEQKGYTTELKQDIIEGFREVVEENGYRFGGIYCNYDWYLNYIPYYAITKYRFWVASYAKPDEGTAVERVKPQIRDLSGWQYSEKGRIPGFGDQGICCDIWYDDIGDEEIDVPVSGVSAEEIIRIARSDLGKNQYDMSHSDIIDTYNAYSPLARGYKVQYTDSWCDTFVSYLFIRANAVDIIGGTECGVEKHVEKFISAGIWNEDGTIVPIPGDIIVFNWDEDSQPNNGFADHIGIVEYVEGSIVHTIEGNSGGYVKRQAYRIGEGCIRGYARPKYATTSQEAPERPKTSPESTTEDSPMLSQGSAGEAVRTLQKALNGVGYNLDVDGDFGPLTRAAVVNFQKIHGLEVDGIVGPITWGELLKRKSVEELAQEVLDKKWGNDPERSKRLTEAGYDAKAVQAEVNRLWAERMNEWK